MTRQLRVEPDGVAIDAADHETILQAARRGGVALPYECGWGSCGACKVTLVNGQVDLIFPGAPAVNPRDARRNRILACQSRAISDVTIARGPGEWSAPVPRCVEQQAILRDVVDLAPEVRQFSFETIEPIDFRPGQYAILQLGVDLRRSYSMCNLPGSNVLQFIAKRYDDGKGSNVLAGLSPGARITIELPFGTCTLRRKPGRKVFVAGGTGVAPILAMMREAAEAQLDFGSPVDVIYGARTPADLAADDMLEAAIARVPQARYLAVVENAPSGWPHAAGFVTDAIRTTIADPTAAEFYVAGPPVMVGAVKSLLRSADVPITQVHYDAFG
ncbi:2Fe-2S iron-sulfur cluster binding domain-containing protein [Bradyrhizobium ontarionense]|uniref:2Fe-2S iron-sulfur cluster binding domain-containing protein n=1 Tax=Bradyrhizobium ontarionense TaxID=2898149 RepID=A0ABY3RKY2_9BRAD|nr:2Fe-2S iron-sulfur cluster binding domain-containing protein [Bradyrhizobium sp. A19]UFZ08155.1 2Fe-2S iron-sulfur cluster binding domain-containing protein [Bradyrhizobium sp. A19]